MAPNFGRVLRPLALLAFVAALLITRHPTLRAVAPGPLRYVAAGGDASTLDALGEVAKLLLTQDNWGDLLPYETALSSPLYLAYFPTLVVHNPVPPPPSLRPPRVVGALSVQPSIVRAPYKLTRFTNCLSAQIVGVLFLMPFLFGVTFTAYEEHTKHQASCLQSRGGRQYLGFSHPAHKLRTSACARARMHRNSAHCFVHLPHVW